MKLPCKTCRKRTRQTWKRSSRLVGRGADAYYVTTFTCLECGATEKSKMYPNLLSDFFSIPKR